MAAVTVLIFTVVSASLSSPAALSSTTTTIAVIGDSYTAGSPEGGTGPNSWPVLAGQLLAREGVEVEADVAAEGGAGYGQRGSRGSIFQDLTAQAARRNDALVIFFGSRNDEPVDPQTFPALAAGTFQLARFAAPGAKILVIGPPWPTAGPPPAVLKIRDSLRDQATLAGAAFIDPIAEGWFVGRPNLIGPDGVHPTDTGHAYLAEKIAPLIFDQLTIAV
ncbi:GDSL lipase [Mycolicibacterium sp.]|uniref:Rv0518 family GDSL lipase n=1 Tax=Mycolicibacterium sp. TaxID=2320850 RepID=UPI0025E05494|nr:GDSL lipase [Mycolicibacterium sp.]